MPALTERIEFAPPAPPGFVRALGLALLAHGMLVAALTWSINWKRHSTELRVVEAQLWASVPQTAAPKLVEPPPEAPLLPPKPVEDPKVTAPEIVQEKKKSLPKVQPKPEMPPVPMKPKVDAQALTKAEAQKRLAEEAKQLEVQRQENLKRIAGMAGATGSDKSTGTTQQSSGATASDGKLVSDLIYSNTRKNNDFNANLVAIFEIKISPVGKILSIQLTKSSGNPAWDDVALRGIELTREKGGIPGNIAGRIPSVFPVRISP